MSREKRWRRLILCWVAVALMALMAAPAMAYGEDIRLSVPQLRVASKAVKAKKLTLSRKTRTLYLTRVANDPLNEKDSFQLGVKISPSSAEANEDMSLVQFKSSAPHIAEVDDEGFVWAKRTGKTKITVRLLDGSKKSATCVVTVKYLPTSSVSLLKDPTHMQPGEEIPLKPVMEPETVVNQSVTYQTSNKKILTVSKDGVLKAIAPGKAKIKMISKANKKATHEFTVQVAYKYRLYGISNGEYNSKTGGIDALENWKPDQTMISSMYRAARFEGGSIELNQKSNLTGDQMRAFLKTISTDTSINDDSVTIFYYSGHGVGDGLAAGYLGALVGVDWHAGKQNLKALVTTGDLLNALSKIKGEVIVIIDACYSGALISKNGTATYVQRGQGQRASDAIIAAFAAKSRENERIAAKALSPMIHPQFHVLTAASDSQESFAVRGGTTEKTPWPYKEFRSLLTHMIKEATYGEFTTKLAADTNGDKKVSMYEAYLYARQGVSSILAGTAYTQTVQLWPMGDNQVMFELVQ